MYLYNLFCTLEFSSFLMNLNKYILAILFAITSYLCSCSSDDSPTSIGSGFIELNISTNPNVIYSSQNLIQQATIIPKPDDFSLKISNIDCSITKSWNSFSDFPQNMPIQIGTYSLTATYGDINSEGFDCPYYEGSTNIQITENNTSNANIECKLANSMITLSYTDEFKAFFDDFSTQIHSEGGSYITYDKNETRPLYIKPGKISLITSLTKNGISTTFQPAELTNVIPQHHYHITLDIKYSNEGNGILIISFDDNSVAKDISINLTNELLNAPSPEISTIGFNNDEIIEIIEGVTPGKPIIANVTAESGLEKLTLTTQSKALIEKGFPQEIDLLNATEEQISLISTMGLNISERNPDSPQHIQLDFSNLLSNISLTDNNDISTFTIIAKDKYSKVNLPVKFNATISPIEINASGTLHSVIGIEKVSLQLTTSQSINPSKLEFKALNDKNIWIKCNIDAIKETDINSYFINLTIPTGVNDVPLNIIYNDIIKSTTTISRISPQFTIEVDAFANKALIKINAENEALSQIITQNIKIFANDFEPAILNRNISNGIVAISGLKPETSYLIKGTLMKGNPNAKYSNIVRITTESKNEVPDGDFEDFKERINCVLLCGGKYSQTHMPIFNQQNKATVKVSTPKKNWATVNAKTFCESSTNLNTWYLQPSAAIVYDAKSGSKAMKLSSVAWDTNGEEIPNYMQEVGSYKPYNENIPKISYRAAGKLFLGEYSFDVTSNSESYTQGVPFSSRPTALNGYYKYTPGALQLHDKGIVKVSIIHKTEDTEIEIAHGEFLFSGNSDYASFNVPLSYNSFGIKATHLKIMFASTSNIGTIEDETMKIITTNDAPSASSIGSELWIDNLTFSY